MDVSFSVSPSLDVVEPLDTAPVRTPRRRARTTLVVQSGYVFVPGGRVIDLASPSPRSRLACALLDALREQPGVPVSAGDLSRQVWPSGGVSATSLKVTVHRLRLAGLPIRTVAGGYVIDRRTRLIAR